MAMLAEGYELNEIDENLLTAGVVTQKDIRTVRVAEIAMLTQDFSVFERIAKDQWDGKTLHYHGEEGLGEGQIHGCRFVITQQAGG